MISTLLALVLVQEASIDATRDVDRSQDETKIRELVQKLSGGKIQDRETASEDLVRAGKAILPILKGELAKTTDEELKARLADVIDRVTRPVFVLEKEVAWEDYLGHSWTPDGKRYLTGQKIFDTETWKRDDVLEKLKPVAFSPDGKLIAVAVFEETDSKIQIGGKRVKVDARTAFRFLATDTLKEVSRLEDATRTEQWFGDTRFLGNDRIVFLAERIRTLESGNGGTSTGAHPVLVVAALKEGTWAVEREIETHTNTFETSPDGKWLCAPPEDATLTGELGVFDTTSRKEAVRFLGNVRFSPDSTWVAVTKKGATDVKVYSAGDWKQRCSLTVESAHDFVAPPLSFTSDSRTLVMADKTLRAWRPSDGKEIASTKPWGVPLTLSCSPQGDLLVVGCYEGDLKKTWHEQPRKLLVYRLRQPK